MCWAIQVFKQKVGLWLCCDYVVIVLWLCWGMMWTCDLPRMCFSTMYITEQRNGQSTTAVRSSTTWGVVTSIRFRVVFTQCSRGCCKLWFTPVTTGNGKLIKSLRSLIILVWEKEIERCREDVSIAVSLWCVKCSFECCDQWRCRIVLYLPTNNSRQVIWVNCLCLLCAVCVPLCHSENTWWLTNYSFESQKISVGDYSLT